MDKYFIQMLRDALQPELRRASVKIFVDRYNLKEGGRWPRDLCDALAHSRILVPLLCAGYWESEWCKKELAIMLQREAECGITGRANSGLIIPIIIHDGDRRPQIVKEIQSFVANRNHIRAHLSSKAGLERFAADVAIRIAECIFTCPNFNESFSGMDGSQYLSQLTPPPEAGGFPGLA